MLKTPIVKTARKGLDGKDTEIAEFLISQPDATVDQIAAHAGLTKDTAYKRLKRMRREGILDYNVRLRESVFPLRFVSFVHIDLPTILKNVTGTYPYRDVWQLVQFLQLNLMGLPQCEPFTNKVFVEDAMALMGSSSADILLFLASRNTESVFDLMTLIVGDLPGIREFSTVEVFRKRHFQSDFSTKKATAPVPQTVKK